jgi:hypothetical protein
MFLLLSSVREQLAVLASLRRLAPNTYHVTNHTQNGESTVGRPAPPTFSTVLAIFQSRRGGAAGSELPPDEKTHGELFAKSPDRQEFRFLHFEIRRQISRQKILPAIAG